jgi:phytoene synthase
LVRLHWPVELRPAFDALFDIDDAMADVVARATEPALAAIKLAWWREQLERLDDHAPPAEPRLQAAAAELLPRGIKGEKLAGLEAGWATLFDEFPDPKLVEERGEALFGLAARLLGASHLELPAAGRLYALMDVTRRGLYDLRAAAVGPGPVRFPSKLRPLSGLASLARRDLGRDTIEPEATPGRSWTLIRHRLTGRL